MHLVTLKDCNNHNPDSAYALEKVLLQLRHIFSRVFSQHYAQIILRAQHEKNHQVLGGFADLEKKYFPKRFNSYTAQQICEKLAMLYQGVGFDDEVAFLRVYKNGHQNLNGLSDADIQELADYEQVLISEKRSLKEVDFVALFDEQNKCHGFAVYHIMQHGDQTILHVRQAAMLEQNRGYAMTLAAYLTDLYPHAYYEANQRAGNTVQMKNRLQTLGLLNRAQAVLGYNDDFYFGLKSNQTTLLCMLQYFQMTKKHDPRDRYTLSRAAKKFFSPVQFARETFTDDMQLSNEKCMYIKRQSF